MAKRQAAGLTLTQASCGVRSCRHIAIDVHHKEQAITTCTHALQCVHFKFNRLLLETVGLIPDALVLGLEPRGPKVL